MEAFDVKEIVNDNEPHKFQMAIQGVVRKHAGCQANPDRMFSVVMRIISFAYEPVLSDPVPTMFTTHGKFKRSVEVHPDEDPLDEIWMQTNITPVPPIMRIKSNYGDEWHESYVPKKKKKSKRAPKKKTRGIQGAGTAFNSQATFTVRLSREYNTHIVLDNGEILERDIGLKIFRQLKYVAPNCITFKALCAKAALNIVLDALNNVWPVGYYVNWDDLEAPMHNFRYQLLPDPEKCVEVCGRIECKDLCRTTTIDLRLLTRILIHTWRDDNMANPPDREDTNNYAGLLVRFRSGYDKYEGEPTTVTVCIQKSGKFTINGKVSPQFYMTIWEWCNWKIGRAHV